MVFLLPYQALWADEVEVTAPLCHEIGHRLGSVTFKSCLHEGMQDSKAKSVQARIIAFKEYPPLPSRTPQARILLIGGIHGDELSSVSIVFHWMEKLDRYHSGLFHWHVIPVLNPDGLLNRPSQRMNAHGVDLNRNFDTPNWKQETEVYWYQKTKQDPRRYPGTAPLSEPESRFLAQEIEAFKPHAIVSVHAPYGILDFDGPPRGPSKLGRLHVKLLGTYPGSLGNYAGVQRHIPVITIELPYAGIMPSKAEQSHMWVDLVRWLKRNIPKDATLHSMRQKTKK
jgi:hypothetical protein